LSFPEGTEVDPVVDAVEAGVGVPVSRIDRLSSGNSQVFRVECGDGRRVLAKAYPDPSEDGRDRLGTEYGALRFLWDQGVQDVPEPICCDVERRVGVYAFIEGKPPKSVTGQDVDNASRFIGRLLPLRGSAETVGLPLASEACLDGPSYVGSVARRFERFREVEPSTPFHEEAVLLVQDTLTPLFEQIKPLMSDCSVPASQKILSPSDFGFHNAIRQPDGALVFVDFEYFGWDDPAKMISDFILHPGHTLPANGPSRFIRRILSDLGDKDLKQRLRQVYPLLALKWCFILMNEFLSGSAKRRRRASGVESVKVWQTEVLSRQLTKARQMVEKTQEALEPGFVIGEVTL
jgi:thiamine kinase-like enzyme